MAKAEKTGDVIDREKYSYGRTRVKGEDGKVRTSTGNGDAVARAMLTVPLGEDAMKKVIKVNGLNDKLGKHIGIGSGINPGQLRMIVGNALRAIVRKGEQSVTIGEIVVKKLDQNVKIDEAPPPKARGAKEKKPAKEKKAKPAKKASKKAKPAAEAATAEAG